LHELTGVTDLDVLVLDRLIRSRVCLYTFPFASLNLTTPVGAVEF
jgi:hypothetical protein